MFEFKNYVVKIMSNSPSGHLIRLQGKLIVTEKEKPLHTLAFYYIFQYSTALVISRFQWLI
jgi:hypothetical protein